MQVYDLNVVAEKTGVPGGFLIGAGAGSHTFLGANSEVREHYMMKAKYYYLIIPRNRWYLLLLDVNPSLQTVYYLNPPFKTSFVQARVKALKIES